MGIDNSAGQLATARALQREFGLEFPVHLGNAEATPFPDASFDFAISEYGAAIWCDPYAWIPEAARLLRPGGRLMFLGGSAVASLALPDLESEPATDRLRRPQRGMYRCWPDDPGVEFHISPGEWIRLLRRCGFEIEDLVELYAPETATGRRSESRPSGRGSGPAKRSGRRASRPDPERRARGPSPRPILVRLQPPR